MRSVLRLLKFAGQSIARNFWLSFVTTTVLLLMLLTVNMLIVMNVLADASIKSIQDSVQVEVYFNAGTSEDIEKSVHGYLSALPEVKDVAVVSAEDSLAAFRAFNENNPEVLAALDEVGGNPIGDSLLISAHNPDDFEFILAALDSSPEYAPFIKEKNFADHQIVIDKLSHFSDQVRWIGLALAAFFALISVLIVFNTIRVAIYVHRDEIAVMKLVGAQDWFVRGPFLLEAIAYSAAATLIMAAASMGSLRLLQPHITTFFEGVNVDLVAFYWSNGWLIFGAQFLALSALSMITTMFAMRKYLKI
ncbi:MAG: permease-like cell division protein FtsX [Patescibacteria group bacterium]